jgi:streptogramin lyase
MTIDQKGILWTDVDGHGLGRIDPRTGSIDFYPAPPGMGHVGASIDVDGHGKVWVGTDGGVIRFDSETKKFEKFFSLKTNGRTYGVSGDPDGNGWWTEFAVDRVGTADPITGKVREVTIQPPWVKNEEDLRTPEDREFYESIGVKTWGSVHMHLGAQAPRRMAYDPNGHTVWVANFVGDNVASIDTRTLATRYYRSPFFGGMAYKVDVDNYGNVWTNLHSDDRLLRLEPKTGKWTAFQLPTNGCETRNVWVDRKRDEVWTPCSRTNRVNRLQFRTAQEIQAQKSAAMQ